MAVGSAAGDNRYRICRNSFGFRLRRLGKSKVFPAIIHRDEQVLTHVVIIRRGPVRVLWVLEHSDR